MSKEQFIEWCFHVGSVYDVNKTIALFLLILVVVLTTYLIKTK